MHRRKERYSLSSPLALLAAFGYNEGINFVSEAFMNPITASWIDAHSQELVSALQTCLSFPTVRDDATACEGAPFGIAIRQCLDSTLALARDLGLETKDLDGYCGCVDFGEGEEQLGILAHLDVVPEGNGWKHPPYGGVIEDGVLYGRGALDDKGPAIAALFALAAVKESGLKMHRRVRLILGCDEESGMGCLEHYAKVEPFPDLSFSPDAEYPLVNSEKTIYGSVYEKAYASAIRVKAGTVSNAVPGEAECFIPLTPEVVSSAKVPEGFSAEVTAAEGGATLRILGKAAHASMPEFGKNAFLAALDMMAQLPLPAADTETVSALAKVLGFDLHGELLGLDCEDASGRLTMNVGVVEWDETGIHRLTVDIRAPNSANIDDITAKLQAGFGSGGLSEISHNASPGYYVSPDSELVQALMGVYRDHFHDDRQPMAIGGGTYARHLTNAVAFGPERPGVEAPIHMPNERISIEHLIDDAKIYADAIIALACEL